MPRDADLPMSQNSICLVVMSFIRLLCVSALYITLSSVTLSLYGIRIIRLEDNVSSAVLLLEVELSFLTIREATWSIISVVSVCLCHTITFESLDLESLYLHIRYISKEYGSSTYIKVIGSRSRSQEQKRSKIPIPAM